LTPPFWGLLTALGFGTADFIARYTGRALGVRNALLGMLLAGTLALGAAMPLTGLELDASPQGWALLTLSGLGNMVAILLLYLGLTWGPVSVMAPICSSYPALTVAFSLLRGQRPSALEWLGMAVVIAGGALVALSAEPQEARDFSYTRAHVRRTALLGVVTAAVFAVTILAAQEAIPRYGELQTVWITRVISLVFLGALFLLRRQRPSVPVSWWPAVGAQGLLDLGAYVALLVGSSGGNQIAVVVGSSFSAVTVILARIVLGESVQRSQWLGVALVVLGVGTLASQS
jgi:drug/metabolite transporter (DMT)-like permease